MSLTAGVHTKGWVRREELGSPSLSKRDDRWQLDDMQIRALLTALVVSLGAVQAVAQRAAAPAKVSVREYTARRDSLHAAVERYHGIGVRIEDDYVATPRDVARITSAPREIDEIERLMRGAAR
jgi:hypothetical protein